MANPDDPLYIYQWHFALIGDIETIWDDYDGSGVNVGVYDDGVNYAHEDLAANYDASLHVVDDSLTPIDPAPILSTDGHGTACAGIIGAADNGVGGVGVAHGVTLTGVNIDFDNSGLYGSINAPDYAPFVDIVLQAANLFDITSNSWGSFPAFYADISLLGGGFAEAVNGAYEDISEDGRGGLGTIIVQAAGNDDEDANGAGLNASRFTITVAATDETGFAAYYSQFGASILVTAPAASVTTDLMGGDGYDPGNYTSTFNGTSAATPVVSGVVALMLDANSGLGWRDVQNILANSASLTGSAFNDATADPFEDGLWYANSGDGWNGGGNHVHTNYGYGMVNVFNAVRMAEVWTLFGAAQTSANEVHVTSGLNDFADTVVPDGNTTGFSTTFTISSDVRVEHVSLTLDFTAQDVGDLRIVLTSAEGTVVVVALESAGMNYTSNGEWVFGIDSLRGELSAGTWTMQVTDTLSGDALTVRSATLDIYGSASTINDVYHFTDEYALMVGFDATRGTISDTDGGFDWLDMAAVTANIALSLVSGQSFSYDGTVLGTLSGVFENIVTGDGNDVLTGTTGSNSIHGMRGNDKLNGGGGTDTLVGGVGNDTYVTDGGDTITEAANAGTDTVQSSVTFTLLSTLENLVLTGSAAINGTGNAGTNRITGNGAANVLNGAGGSDSLGGGAGNDTYVTDGGDTITEGANQGTDTVQSSVSFTLGAELENLVLTGSGAINGTGNTLSNRITGNSAANTLKGSSGNDTFIGGGGNDVYITDGGDTITESSGQGTDRVESSVTITLGANLENLTLTGSGKINGTGNTLKNEILGNTNANVLNGGGGADKMAAGKGNDTYITDGGDKITEASGQGTDVVQSSATHTLAANVENLVLTGSGSVNGTGNTMANRLTGNKGSNDLNGLTGADTLTGGNGADDFIFSTALGGGNVDQITDFNVVADTIRIENAVFKGLATGVLKATAFESNTTGNAADAQDRIIYEKDTGKLFYDKDGAGGASKVLFVTVDKGLALTHADFFVF